MFPIPFNFPFRKKDGSLTTIDDAITSGGGSYTLPTASANTKGGIKIGSGLSMSGETLNNSNPTPYTLPTANADTKGGVKVGDGLSIDENGVLSVSGGGGGGLNYVDITLDSPLVIAQKNELTLANVQAVAATGLVGKRIVSICNTDYPIACIIGFSCQHDPIRENDWIRVFGASSSNNQEIIRTIRIFYV